MTGSRPYRDVRSERFAMLLAEAGGPKALAEKTATVSNQPTPDSHLTAISKGRRNVGDDLADTLERAMRKPRGWMDLPVTASIPTDISGVAATGQAGTVTASVTPEQTVERLAQLLDGLDADALQRAREALALLGGAPDSERVKTALAQALAGSLRVESRTVATLMDIQASFETSDVLPTDTPKR